MRRLFIIFLFFFGLNLFFTAYLQADNVTKTTELQTLSQQLNDSYVTRHAAALELAQRLDFPVKRTLADGTQIDLQFFSDKGRPIFYKTNNLNAARTISTDKVWSGGNAGLELDGSGLTLHEWDAGMVRTTHQEFNGKSNYR